ncbi:SEC-C metal-binding domain-containing protein [Paludisphaera mucosa]|uniref:SEC-C metal-binding domain-containing protein n=1 Tax=Paludisphaera mucosa TaxID=3030827 RepID=UPI0034A2F827
MSEKLGRNDLCPCGSGRLFKKCCRDAGCFRRRRARPLRAMIGATEGSIEPCTSPPPSPRPTRPG